MQNRDKSVDIAKGIGIVLVVWGHTFGACPIYDEIHLFHMPLFFFVGGFFIADNDNPVLFVYKKYRTLLIPFIFFYSISLAIKFALQASHTKGIDHIVTDSNFFSLSNINYPLWFILCLFTVSALYFFICKLIRNKFIHSLLIILLALTGFLLFYKQIELPLYLSQAFVVLPFLHLGKIYYKKKNTISYNINNLFLFFSSILFIIGVIWKLKVDLGALVVDSNPFLFYLPALGGIVIILKISEWIVKYKWRYIFLQLGSYSLFILALHANMRFLNNIVNFLSIHIYQFTETSYSSPIDQTVLWGILKTVISIPICYVIGIILKKYLPILWNYSKNDPFIMKMNYKKSHSKNAVSSLTSK